MAKFRVWLATFTCVVNENDNLLYADIIEGPKNQTVFLDPNKDVIFTCKTSTYENSAIDVYINNKIQHNEDISKEHSSPPPPVINSIKIKQITKYNNSNVKCVTQSETAVSWLQIQGIYMIY